MVFDSGVGTKWGTAPNLDSISSGISSGKKWLPAKGLQRTLLARSRQAASGGTANCMGATKKSLWMKLLEH
jgi:hypothetical protein